MSCAARARSGHSAGLAHWRIDTLDIRALERNFYSYMKRDSRLSNVLHALLHMAEHEGPMSSEMLAQCMTTNPVVVRRTMGLLREHGIVASAKGHAGGWSITADFKKLTIRDLYAALGEPTVFAMGHRSDTPSCLVEQSVNAMLDDAYIEAERLLMERFADITLADLAAEFARRHAAHKSGQTYGKKKHAP